MTTVKIEDFKGENRARTRELIPVNVATTAVDCKLTDGALRAFRGRRRVYKSPVPGTRTIYRFGADAGGDAQAPITRVLTFDANLVQIDSPLHPLAVGDRVYINDTGTALDDATYPVVLVLPNAFRLAYTTPVGTVLDAGYWVKQNGHWFTWDALVHVVRGPIGTDAEERTYFTGVGKPQMTTAGLGDQGAGPYPSASYDLGVPAPATRPQVALVLPVGNITFIYGTRESDPVTAPVHMSVSNEDGLTHNCTVRLSGIFDVFPGPLSLNDKVFRLRRYRAKKTSKITWILLDPDTSEFITQADLRRWRHQHGPPYDIEFLVLVEGSEDRYVNDAGEEFDVQDTNSFTYSPLSAGAWTLDTTKVPAVDKESRFYVQTYVSTLDEEGPPSLASAHLLWSPGTSIALSELATGPASGNYNLDRKRLYRLATVDSQGAYQFVAELPLAQTTFSDDVDTVDLGEVLQSLTWDPPPANLKQLIALPNGVLAGISGRQLCLSVPNQPHAWPTLTRDNANDPLVALGNFGTTIVACTRAALYLAQGANPDGVRLELLDPTQGCAAAASMVSLGLYGVAFASLDGLVLVGPQGWQLVTESYYTRDAWQIMRPRSIRAVVHDRRYFAFYGVDGGVQRGFIFDAAPDGMGLTFLEFYANGGLADPLSDHLFVVVNDHIEAFDNLGSDPEPYRWEKRLRDLSQPVNFSCAEVLAEDYDDLTFRLFADGVIKFTKAVTSKAPFRLPAGFTTRDVLVRLEGTATVTKLMLAEDVDELLG